MPNWCSNHLTVKGEVEEVQRFKAQAVGHSPWEKLPDHEKPSALNFHSLVPVPAEVFQAGYEAQGYDWECNNWGGKTDNWCMQEKQDGRRLLIRKRGQDIDGINKKGNTVGLALPLFDVLKAFDADVIIDGESIGDNLYAFDLLELDGVDIRSWPYRERLAALMNLLFSVQQRIIKLVHTA
jgi:hypothetical protein